MEPADTIKIMEEVRRLENANPEEHVDIFDGKVLQLITTTLHGHPLAATIAMNYIIHVQSEVNSASAGRDFISMLSRAQGTKDFLTFKPAMTASIMDTFLISKARLPSPQDPAWSLMEVLSILETDDSDVDFRAFFFSSSFGIDKNKTMDGSEDIFQFSKENVPLLLNQIKSVSFAERVKDSRSLKIHPLWMECTRQLMGIDRMLVLMEKVLTICFDSMLGSDNEHKKGLFYPHMRHCLKICHNFDIDTRRLQLKEGVEELVICL